MRTMKWNWSDREVIRRFTWTLWILGLNKGGHAISDNELKQIYMKNKW